MCDTTKKINLRELDDVSCSNVVISRQIKKILKKAPSFSEFAMDCYVHGTHYTHFKFTEGNFVWTGEVYNHRYGKSKISSDNFEDLYNDEINKLLVSTITTINESNQVDVVDTPEDLLAIAEQKLREMINSDAA